MPGSYLLTIFNCFIVVLASGELSYTCLETFELKHLPVKTFQLKHFWVYIERKSLLSSNITIKQKGTPTGIPMGYPMF